MLLLDLLTHDVNCRHDVVARAAVGEVEIEDWTVIPGVVHRQSKVGIVGVGGEQHHCEHDSDGFRTQQAPLSQGADQVGHQDYEEQVPEHGSLTLDDQTEEAREEAEYDGTDGDGYGQEPANSRRADRRYRRRRSTRELPPEYEYAETHQDRVQEIGREADDDSVHLDGWKERLAEKQHRPLAELRPLPRRDL